MQKSNCSWLDLPNSSYLSAVSEGATTSKHFCGAFINPYDTSSAHNKHWFELQINFRSLLTPYANTEASKVRSALSSQITSIKLENLNHLSPFFFKSTSPLIPKHSHAARKNYYVLSHNDEASYSIFSSNYLNNCERLKEPLEKHYCIAKRRIQSAEGRLDPSEITTLKDMVAELVTPNADSKYYKEALDKDKHDGRNNLFTAKTNDAIKDDWSDAVHKLTEQFKMMPDEVRHAINRPTQKFSLETSAYDEKVIESTNSLESMSSCKEQRAYATSKGSASDEEDWMSAVCRPERRSTNPVNMSKLNISEEVFKRVDLKWKTVKLRSHGRDLTLSDGSDGQQLSHAEVECKRRSDKKFERITKELRTRYDMCFDDTNLDGDKHELERV